MPNQLLNNDKQQLDLLQEIFAKPSSQLVEDRFNTQNIALGTACSGACGGGNCGG